jgi:hypothetical protein
MVAVAVDGDTGAAPARGPLRWSHQVSMDGRINQQGSQQLPWVFAFCSQGRLT